MLNTTFGLCFDVSAATNTCGLTGRTHCRFYGVHHRASLGLATEAHLATRGRFSHVAIRPLVGGRFGPNQQLIHFFTSGWAFVNLSLRYQPKPLKHGDTDTCTCPHCWTVFPLEDALYVSRHPDLLGDPVLGSDAPSRFKPTRFTAEGHAIDPGGHPCLEMACPNCHLEVPRSLAEFKTHFFSIIGTPSSGKSFFLGTLAWELRRIMPAHFGMAFADLETGLNEVLHSYEDTLFFAKDRERFVSIKKTEQQGELYNRVNFGGTETLLPKPFVITLRPQPHHPQFAHESEWTRTLVLYDNAGEHFDPRADTVQQPGTMHMAKSECLFFILDPTQDPRFRERVHGHPDPQLGIDFRVQRQDVVFNEAARRIRRHLGIPHGKKYHKNVIVVVNKCDIWQSLLKTPIDAEPFLSDPKFPVNGINTPQVEDVSFSVRWLLQDICPEVVTAVEDFADHVVYVPVSALGHSPTRNPKTLALEVRPIDIRPKWITVPFLYAFSKLGLVYRAKRPSTTHATARVISRFGGRLVCSLPDESEIEVPERYAGCVLHHPQSGIPFIVPKADNAT